MAAIATVVNIRGEVFAVNAQGVKRQLHNGDKLQEGEVLVTAPGSTAELEMDGGKHFTVPEHQTFVIDASVASGAETPEAASAALAEGSGVAQKVIQALQSGDPNALIEAEATAAGLAGQGGGDEGGVSFVRLLRITEGVTPLEYNFGINAHAVQDVIFTGAAIEETPNSPPTIGVKILPPGETNGRPFLTAAEGTVFESGLSPNGSDAAGNGEFANGAFQVTDPNGLTDISSVTINGQTIAIGSLVGSVITTPLGVMTITSYADGVAHFTYELKTTTTDVPNQTEMDIFTLTVTDAQSATSDPAEILITIVDDVPSVSIVQQEISPLVVDETVLATDDTVNFSGLFAPLFGADGPAASNSLVYALSVNGGNGTDSGLVDSATGQHVLLYMNGSNIEGRTATGGDVVFVISVDGSGNVTLDQQRAVMHDTGSDPDTSEPASIDPNLVLLTATATDGDGDTASANIDLGAQISFLDDGPSISLADVSTPALSVDESFLATDDTVSFSGVFASSFGADGAGSLAYALSVNGGDGTDSGLVDSATGQHVLLYMNGSNIEGRTATGGDVVFVISVDGSGNVTLDQQRAVMHDTASSPDTSEAASIDPNLVVLTATVTDKDGDTASAQIDLGSQISFLDDGPAISLADVTTPTLTVDESYLANGTTPDATLTHATTDFSGVFASSFGADGAGSLVYTLNISGSSGMDSGLVDSATGGAVLLYAVDATHLEGRVGTDVVFTVSVDGDGNVTLTQLRSVHEGTGESGDISEGVSLNSLTDLVTLTATITDADGDHQAATIDLGSQLTFLDDGPSATAEPGRDLVEGGTVTGTLDFVGGADGATVTHINDIALVFGLDGYSQQIDIGDGMLKVKADGTYSFTADASVIGSVTDSATFTVTDKDGDTSTAGMSFNITDANSPLVGDTAVTLDEEGLSGGLAGGPGDVTGTATTFSSTFTDFSYGGDGQGLTGGISVSGGFLTLYTLDGTQVQATWDQSTSTLTGMAGSVKVFDLVVDQSNGDYTVTLYQPVKHSVAGTEDNVAFTVTVTVTDADGSTNTGDFTLTINDDSPVAHIALNGTPVLAVDETNGVGVVGEVDPVGGNLGAHTITAASLFTNTSAFGSDGAASSNATIYSLSLLSSASTGLTDTLSGSAVVLVNNAGVIEGHAGTAGGALVFTLSINSSTGDVTLTQYRAVVQPDGTNPDGSESVTLASDLVGVTVTVTDGDGDTSAATANLNGVVQFLDDGPTVAITAAGTVTLALDETTTTSTTATIGTGAIVKGDDPDVSGSGYISTATSSGAVVTLGTEAYGADGAATSGAKVYALTVGNSGDSGLHVTDGAHITLSLVNGVIVGVVDSGTFADQAAFAISINSTTGVVTVEQYLSLHQDSLSNTPDDTVSLAANSVNVTVTLKDGDGDTVTSSAADISGQISFADDGPSVAITAAGTVTLALDETATTSTAATIDTGSIVKGDDPDVSGSGYISTATSSGAVVTVDTAAFGADGPAASGATVYALTVTDATPAGLMVTDGSAITLVLLSNGVVVGQVSGGAFDGQAAFAISIDSATGVVTVEQYLSLHQDSLSSTPNDVYTLATGSLGVTVTLTDGDGDKVTSSTADVSGQISFADDGPTLTHIDSAIVANETGEITGTTDVLFGADGAAAVAALKITGWTDVDGITEVLSNNDTVLTGYIGDPLDNNVFYTLTMNTDGTYTLAYNERPTIDIPLTFPDAKGASAAETLDATAGAYTVSFNGALWNGTTLVDYPLSNVDDVKTTGSGFGVGSPSTHQTEIDNNEGFFTTFWDGAVGGTLLDVTGFSFSVVNQGSVPSVTVHWKTYNDGVLVDDNSAGTTYDVSTSNVPVPVLIGSGNEFDTIQVWFDGMGSNEDVRIENFSLQTSIIAQDEALTFDVAAVDGDGDVTSSVSFDVTLQGGSGPDYTVSGNTEILTGGDGNDSVIGGSADQLLIGGAGSDTLTGGLGTDTFQWLAGDQGSTTTPAHDTITDWGTGGVADKLDLRDLLQGEHDGSSADSSNLTNYLHFNTVGGTTTISVSSTGTVGVSHDQEIVLTGVDLNSGNTISDATVIANLLSANKLITDA